MAKVHPILPSGTSPAEALTRAILDTLSSLVPPAPADELRPVAAWAEAWGLERRGLADAVRRAGVPTVRVGRQLCARRSDVLAVVDRLAERRAEPKEPATDYAAVVAAARGRR